MSALIDLTGNRYGKLTVLCREGSWRDREGLYSTPMWRCRCDCGRETVVIGQNLKQGKTQSCGCIKRGRKKNGGV